MRTDSRRVWVIFGILFAWLILAILLTFGFRESIRQFLAGPLAYYSGVFRLLAEIIPQPICWGVLLLIGFGWFLRSMSGRTRSDTISAGENFRYPKRERVDFWLLQIRHAQDVNSRGRFADFMSKLVNEVIAYQTRQPLHNSVRMFTGEEPSLPDGIRKILSTWRSQSFQRRKGFISNLWNRPVFQSKQSEPQRNASFEKELEEIVRYLEEELEIKNEP